jgi:hypothetical protein
MKHIEFCAILMEHAKHDPLGIAIEKARLACRLSKDDGFKYFRLGTWLHRVDINLNLPVVMTKAMRFDGGKTLQLWRSHYWPQGAAKK